METLLVAAKPTRRLTTKTVITAATLLWCAVVPQDSRAIYGGEVAVGAPPASAVHITLKRGRVSVSCSGTLVAPRLVLTAAHCVRTERGQARRVTSVRIGNRKKGFIRRRVRKIAVHPRYNPAEPSHGFDVAVLQLRKPVRKFQAVPLGAQEDSPQRHGDRVVVRGFGLTRNKRGHIKRSKKLRQAKLQVITSCFRSPNAARKAEMNTRILCAASPSQGVCHGDSGGPVVRNVGPREVVVGVISNVLDRHRRCVDGMMIATRLSTVAQWLDKQVMSLSGK